MSCMHELIIYVLSIAGNAQYELHKCSFLCFTISFPSATHTIRPFYCSQPDHPFPLLINEFYRSFPDVELYYWYHAYCILIPLLMYHFTLDCYTVFCPSYSSPSLLQSHESIIFKYYSSNNSTRSQNISRTLTSS